MSRPRTYQTEAIIIKKTRLGEADRILTLYTPHLGKIRGFAKGVRRPRSKLAGHLELLTHSQVSLARGRNIDTIIGSQTISSFLPLKSDLGLTSCALYVTELVDQFTADSIENSSLFRLLLETLHNISHGGDSELVLRYFELHLLGEVGYQPELQHCVSCRVPMKAASGFFSPAAGGILCGDCSHRQAYSYPLSVNGVKVLRFMQGTDYANARRLRLPPDVSRELKGVLKSYIMYLLEREVKSAAWLDSLEEQSPDRGTLSP